MKFAQLDFGLLRKYKAKAFAFCPGAQLFVLHDEKTFTSSIPDYYEPDHRRVGVLSDPIDAEATRKDFVVMCRRDVQEPMKLVCRVLERLHLSLNEAKTHVVDATAESFDFLGFSFQMYRGARTGKPYPNIQPSAKSLKKIKAKLTNLSGRTLAAKPLDDVVRAVNRSLRGWVNYFHYRNSAKAMHKVRNHAEARLRTHLMKRHNVRARRIGLARFRHGDLYGRYGLYKVPAGVSWKTAQA